MKGRPLTNFITNEPFKDKQGEIKKFGKKRYLDYIVKMLKINYYNAISCVRALDEGFDVENINVVITTSGTANPTQYAQRSARGKTIDRYSKKRTVIINLYFDDFLSEIDGEYKMFHSRDKAKLIARQANTETETLNLDDFFKQFG